VILVHAPNGTADLLHPDELRNWIAGVGCHVATVVPDPTPAQLDGLACLECGHRNGDMRPVARLAGVQLYAHDNCDQPFRVPSWSELAQR